MDQSRRMKENVFCFYVTNNHVSSSSAHMLLQPSCQFIDI